LSCHEILRFEKEAYRFLSNPLKNKLPRLPITIPWTGAVATTSQQESSVEDQAMTWADSRVLAGTDEAPCHCSCSASSSFAMEEEEEAKRERVSHTFSNKHGLANAEQSPQSDGHVAASGQKTQDWDDGGYWRGFAPISLVEEDTQKDETQTI
jgi:hypothetical protein